MSKLSQISSPTLWGGRYVNCDNGLNVEFSTLEQATEYAFAYDISLLKKYISAANTRCKYYDAYIAVCFHKKILMSGYDILTANRDPKYIIEYVSDELKLSVGKLITYASSDTKHHLFSLNQILKSFIKKYNSHD